MINDIHIYVSDRFSVCVCLYRAVSYMHILLFCHCLWKYVRVCLCLLSLFTPISSCSLFHLLLFPVRLLDLFYLRLNVVFSISSLSVSSAIFASLPFRYIRISAYHMLIINNVCATCHRWKVFEWRNCHSIIKDLLTMPNKPIFQPFILLQT